MKKICVLFILAGTLAFLTGCTLHGRIYNLTTGEVTAIGMKYTGSGHGRIFGTFQSGEHFEGDYTTFPQPPINWGAIYASVYGESRFGWAHSGPLTMQDYGTAIASGDQGFVADCEYVTSSMTHGSGACKGHDGTNYKIMW